MSNKVPQIRFNGYSDAWEERKLGDVAPLRGGFAFKSSEFRNTGVPIVRISNILSSGEVGGAFAYYDEQDKDDKYILPDKSAVLAMSGATTGKVSILSQTSHDKVYQNQRVGYFQSVDCIDYDFISTIVRSELFMMQLESVLVSGAQPNVSSKEIDSFDFMIPKLVQEQQKIGSFFKQLDNTIALHQRKLYLLKEQKKGYLQKMFPKSGEKIPELRFKGFTGDWEERKLGDITTLITKGTTPKDKSWAGTVNYVKTESIDKESGDINTTTFTSLDEHEGYLKRSQLKDNDILFSIVGTLGRVGIIKKDNLPANTNQQISIIRVKKDNPQYILYALKTYKVKQFIESDSTIGAQPALSLWQIEALEIPLPSLEEQEKIGSFFKQLDDTIALHQRKLDLLKEQKKG
ncbi:MAG: restriction endonuclease subunit S, partial [Tetragenococcus koreensis]|nr:restriction endonuclease subunit S [Tetragenococcus koreensis]